MFPIAHTTACSEIPFPASGGATLDLHAFLSPEATPAAGKSASYGLVDFLKFLAFVSVSLGLLNLLPIPVLDGGHLLFFLVEAAKGSPLSDQAQLQAQRVGMAILLALMVLAFYVDLSRLLG